MSLASDYTIFWAWQSDLPNRTNRGFIKDALEKAVRTLSRKTGTQEPGIAPSPRLDHDTKDVPGTPDLARTIFEKIDTALVFVADVSYVGEVGGKLTPNPNVLLETGYAASSIGWSRVLLVLNQEYGSYDEMVFDLKHKRWCISYRLADGDSPETRKQVRETLTKSLARGIRLIQESDSRRVASTVSRLDADCARLLIQEGQSVTFYPPDTRTVRDALGKGYWSPAARRLVELGVLRCVPEVELSDKTNRILRYEWTYFGELVKQEFAKQTLGRVEKRVEELGGAVTVSGLSFESSEDGLLMTDLEATEEG